MKTQKSARSEDTTTPVNREVTVTVKASDLFNLPYPPNKTQIANTTYLVDDEGLESRFGDSNKDFETMVYMGKDMTWEIRSFEPNGVDRGFTTALVSVSHNPDPGNPNFFSSDPLPVGRDGNVTGTIATNPKLPNADDSYTINFTITHDGTVRSFPLDPKLRINTINR